VPEAIRKATEEAKKSMIETLQRLHGAQYFATPNGNAGSRGSVSDLPPRN
jgi:ribosomal protein S5